jgi:prevent-host-death family protein
MLESNSMLKRVRFGGDDMDLRRDIHSLTDFKKNTPEFLQQLKQTGEPVVLTINGRAELVVQDAASYQKLLKLADEARVLEGIRRGLEDMHAGRTQPLADAFADIRSELELPPRS